ncbi:hypothetical protein SAMN05216296_1953 [Pseudomonas pohangensis]|uniref:Uncharacterized protein n=1 Tax=Pseudomonas pohangensis TaxID=364197 RepID=A0A1H2G1K1_9PSED|nr:hypothetical protein [Pseudomonas pohangensis]SDU13148.1 hypothetical protein SAMN05216296_1953 [Pseudomonas pohangensis]
MKKVITLGALVIAVSGCGKSEFALDGVAVSDGTLGKPDATYVERESRKPITGTVRKVQGEVELLSFSVVEGVVDGEWVQRDAKGNLYKIGTLSGGKFVGSEKTYCTGSDKLAIEVDHQSDVVSTTEYDCGTGLVRREFAKVPSTNKPTGTFKQYCAGSDQLSQKIDYKPDLVSTDKYDCATGLALAESRVSAETGKFVGTEKEWAVVAGKQVPTKLVTYSTDGKGTIDGVADEFYPDGSLKSHVMYVNGAKTGDETTYSLYEDGTHRIKSKTVYEDGLTVSVTNYKDTLWPEGTIESFAHYDGLHDYGSPYQDYVIYYNDNEVRLGSYQPRKKTSAAEMGVWTRLQQRERTEPSAQSLEEIKFLIKSSSVDINSMRGPLDVPLLRNSTWRYRDVLLELGADPNDQDVLGQTYLSYCMREGLNKCNIELMARLVNEEKPSVDRFGNTPLILFCRRADDFSNGYSGRYKNQAHAMFDELLKKSDVNAANMRGRTALHECMETGYSRNLDIYYAKALIAAGADTTKTDVSGLLPVQMLFVKSYSSLNSSLSLTASHELVQTAVDFGYDLNTPFPIYDKKLKEIFMESGSAGLAMQIENLGG